MQVGGPVIPIDSKAAVINFTVTGASSRGWALVYPCGRTKPLASTINFLSSEARAVSVIVGLGGSPPGQICVSSNVDIHFVVDVAGYYAPAPSFGPAPALHPQSGERIADSRYGIGGWTTKFAAGETRRIDPVAGSPLADRAAAVMLNVIAVNAETRGHLRVSSCGAGVPTSSAVNFRAGPATSNFVPVDLTGARDVCIYANRATNVVIDLFAVMAVPDGALAERMSPEGIDTWPDFHPAGSDYGLVCSAGVNRFDFELQPMPRTRARINGKTAEPGTHRLSMTENELTTVVLVRGTERREYHFRCLPRDFPVLDVQRPGEPGDGWYLTQFGQGNSPYGPYLAILDEYGAPLWYKRAETQVLGAIRLDDDTIGANNAEIYYGTTDDDVSRRTYGLDGSLIEVRRPPDPDSYPADHHDFVDLPNGGGAFLSYPIRSGVNLSSIGEGVNQHVLDGAIVEVEANGDEAWVWNTKDHFVVEESTYPLRWFRSFPAPDTGEVDLVHFNSLDLAGDGSGDYIVSARHYDAAIRVNRWADGTHAEGAVEWVLGGSSPTATGGAPRLTIVGDPYNGPLRPHDARFDGDVLTIFDNRTQNGLGQPARAVAYRIDARPGVMTATMLWQVPHPGGQASPAQGSARITPDGSVLVSWGGIGPVFGEFTTAGEPLLSIAQVPHTSLYRIIKYAPNAFDAETLRSLAGGDFEVESP